MGAIRLLLAVSTLALSGCLFESTATFESTLVSENICPTSVTGTWLLPGNLVTPLEEGRAADEWSDGKLSIDIPVDCEYSTATYSSNLASEVPSQGSYGIPIRLSFGKLPNGHFMTIRIIDASGDNFGDRLMAKYALSEERTLLIAFPDQQVVIDAIAAKSIDGYVSELGSSRFVSVSSSGLQIAKFLEEFDATLFTTWHELRRIGPDAEHSAEYVRDAESLMLAIRKSKDKTSTSGDLEALATHSDKKVRLGVCRHPSSTAATLLTLAADDDWQVAECVARNPSISTATMERLAAHNSDRVRATLAGAAHADANVLIALANDRVDHVRNSVAFNSNSPLRALELLATDANPKTRASVAKNPNTSIELLASLSKDTDSEVRHRSVSERLPNNELNRLYDDADSRVSGSAQRIVGDRDQRLMQQMRMNPTPDLDALAVLAESRYVSSRRFAAFQPATPAHFLIELSTDEDVYVREKIAGRSSVPLPALKKLATDSNDRVRALVAFNGATPLSALQQLAKDNVRQVKENLVSTHHGNTPVMEMLLLDNDPYIRGLVAASANDINVRLALSNDPDRRVRQGLLMHNSVPLEIAQALANDSDPTIRSTASRWLSETPLHLWPRVGGFGAQLMIEPPHKETD